MKTQTLIFLFLFFHGTTAWAQNLESAIFEVGEFTSIPSSRLKGLAPQDQAAAQLANKWAKFKVSVQTDKSAYSIGEPMDITIMSEKDAKIFVYYVDSKGDSAIVCPSDFSSKNSIKAGVPFKLLDNTGKPMLQNGPTGQETIQVVASVENDFKVEEVVKKEEKKSGKSILGKVIGGVLKVLNPPSLVTSIVGYFQDKILNRSKRVSSRYKGIGPQTKFDSGDSIFGLATATYEVRD